MNQWLFSIQRQVKIRRLSPDGNTHVLTDSVFLCFRCARPENVLLMLRRSRCSPCSLHRHEIRGNRILCVLFSITSDPKRLKPKNQTELQVSMEETFEVQRGQTIQTFLRWITSWPLWFIWGPFGGARPVSWERLNELTVCKVVHVTAVTAHTWMHHWVTLSRQVWVQFDVRTSTCQPSAFVFHVRPPLWLACWRRPASCGSYELPVSWTATQSTEPPSSCCSCASSPSSPIGWPASGTPSATWRSRTWSIRSAGWTTWGCPSVSFQSLLVLFWRHKATFDWTHKHFVILCHCDSLQVKNITTATPAQAPPSKTSTSRRSTSPSAVWPAWALGTSPPTPTLRRSSPSASCSLDVSDSWVTVRTKYS